MRITRITRTIFLQELSEIDHALGTSLSGKASHSAERWRFLALRRCSGTSWRSCKELSGIIILENIINEKFLNNFWPFLLNNNSLLLLLFPSASDLWFVFVNKNLCKSVVSVGNYSCHSSYLCSKRLICVISVIRC